ncbi:hypothetical protein [Sinosporangium siamense]|uniref:Aminoglycoside phosphotransferase n=1 Tax=Sinosporangium siamense TaxID=1367973 RepID=A0A919RP57_9ACTN|nr:hypothetical protein [Sinosporangium siamense]GII97357.1 hypothetical protein Ssi02_75880 [Sinosporangium siamense]
MDEWDLLGFEHLAGRHANFKAGSPDLPSIVETMAVLGEIDCPDLPIKVAEHRWRTYVGAPEELKWLKGDRLLHTDYNPVNVLLTEWGAHLLDWAWPTRGAGWIDPATLILRLIAGGHTPQAAEDVVRDLPAWKSAPSEGVEVFARANVRVWEEIRSNDSSPWIKAMAHAAGAWAKHRTS